MSKNLKNIKIGRLRVLEPTEKREKGSIIWKCKCDCGNIIFVPSYRLTHKRSNSCGCARYEKLKKGTYRLPVGKASRNAVYGMYKKHAAQRGISWNLSDEEFDLIVKQNCFYCEKPPSNIKQNNKNNGIFIYNGIDRVDNSLGYEIDNVVPCCGRCNNKKRDISINIARKMIEFIDRKGATDE